MALSDWPPRGMRYRENPSWQSVYLDAVRDFLKSHGIADPKVRITRILRIDLEGDGEDEVLINATNYFSRRDEAPMHAPKRGSYSIVMLRRVAAGKVQTQLVAGELYSKADASNAPNIYKIATVLDFTTKVARPPSTAAIPTRSKPCSRSSAE